MRLLLSMADGDSGNATTGLRLDGMPRGTVINIGSGQGVTILSVARKLLKILGPREDELDVTADFRPGDAPCCADASLAKMLLGWGGSISLDDGLRLLALPTSSDTKN
jgi:dTDP-L-rhamnose 4-epimerase